MEPTTRRQLLTAITVAAGGVAGCLGATSSSGRSSESSTEGRRSDIPDDQLATDPPRVIRRSESTQPAIRPPDSEDDSEASRPRHRGHHTTPTLIDTESTAQQLIVDGDDSELSAFVSATEFETETLFLQTNPVDDCFELTLCYVSWHEDQITTDYSRVVRPYEDRCSGDRTVLESWLIRLPVALDADSINSFGSSTGGGRCHRTGVGTDHGSNGSRPAADNRGNASADHGSASR
jgi:hypothetical protein